MEFLHKTAELAPLPFLEKSGRWVSYLALRNPLALDRLGENRVEFSSFLS